MKVLCKKTYVNAELSQNINIQWHAQNAVKHCEI